MEDFQAAVASQEVQVTEIGIAKPGSGKVSPLEDFIQNIVDRTKANPKLFAETAIIVSFDESGDLYDMFDLSIASIVKNEINKVKDEIRDIRKGN